MLSKRTVLTVFMAGYGHATALLVVNPKAYLLCGNACRHYYPIHNIADVHCRMSACISPGPEVGPAMLQAMFAQLYSNCMGRVLYQSN